MTNSAGPFHKPEDSNGVFGDDPTEKETSNWIKINPEEHNDFNQRDGSVPITFDSPVGFIDDILAYQDFAKTYRSGVGKLIKPLLSIIPVFLFINILDTVFGSILFFTQMTNFVKLGYLAAVLFYLSLSKYTAVPLVSILLVFHSFITGTILSYVAPVLLLLGAFGLEWLRKTRSIPTSSPNSMKTTNSLHEN